MASEKITQSGDWEYIESGAGKVFTRSVRSLRVDQEGLVDITPEGHTASRGTGNFLQGEVIHIQGKITINNNTTARIQAYY